MSVLIPNSLRQLNSYLNLIYKKQIAKKQENPHKMLKFFDLLQHAAIYHE
jgi:hypothetical protein